MNIVLTKFRFKEEDEKKPILVNMDKYITIENLDQGGSEITFESTNDDSRYLHVQETMLQIYMKMDD